MQRFHWDLRYTPQNPVNLNKSSFYNPFGGKEEGTLVEPGMYTVEMGVFKDGVVKSLTNPVRFEVKPLNNVELPADNRAVKVAFQKSVAKLQADMAVIGRLLSESRNKLRHIKVAIKRVEAPIENFSTTVKTIEDEIKEIQLALYGDAVKRRLDIGQPLSLASRLGSIGYEQKYSTAQPTQTHLESYAIVKEALPAIKVRMERIFNEKLKALEQKLIQAGAPYSPGRGQEYKN